MCRGAPTLLEKDDGAQRLEVLRLPLQLDPRHQQGRGEPENQHDPGIVENIVRQPGHQAPGHGGGAQDDEAHALGGGGGADRVCRLLEHMPAPGHEGGKAHHT